jgi:outer membrane protein OmpA-like peptidoglycan-associated protein
MVKFYILIIILFLSYPIYSMEVCERKILEVNSDTSMCSVLFTLTGKIPDNCNEYSELEYTRKNCKSVGEFKDSSNNSNVYQEISIQVFVFFDFDSYKINKEYNELLDSIASEIFMSSEFSSNHFLIEGHADASGSDEYNFKLSLKRAKEVHGYLVTTYPQLKGRLFFRGKGKTAPLPDKDPFHDNNRRVEFVVKVR